MRAEDSVGRKSASRFVAVAAVALSTGCATLSSLMEEEGAPQAEETAQPVATPLATPAVERGKSAVPVRNVTEDVALLRAEIYDLREKVRSLERDVQALRRGARSGLFEDDTAEKAGKTLARPRGEADPALVEEDPRALVGPMSMSDEGVAPDTAGPARLMSEAETQVKHGQCGRAIVLLNELKALEPPFPDGGRADLVLAQCWNVLGEQDRALTALRSFFLNHPDSPQLLEAKLLQAQAHEGLKEIDRSLQIYKEVIALGPDSLQAREARAALQRLRDMR